MLRGQNPDKVLMRLCVMMCRRPSHRQCRRGLGTGASPGAERRDWGLSPQPEAGTEGDWELSPQPEAGTGDSVPSRRLGLKGAGDSVLSRRLGLIDNGYPVNVCTRTYGIGTVW